MNLLAETFTVAPHPPFGHLLPLEEAGEGIRDQPSPASFRGRRCPKGG
jgi:hypothetical protein